MPTIQGSGTCNLQPLADHLQKELGIKTEVKSYPTVHAFIEGIQKGETDLAFINTFGYLLLEASRQRYPMKPLVALTVPNARDNYKTAFVARGTFPINDLRDLAAYSKQARLLLVAPGSTSGNLVPRLVLTRTGMPSAEAGFASVRYAGTHARAIDALLRDSADLAAMGCSEYTKLDSTKKSALKLVWLSSEIPLGPVLIHTGLAKELQRKIEQALLNIHTEDPVALDSVKAAWTEAAQATRFVRIKKDHYSPFLKQFGTKEQIAPILRQFTN